MLVVTQKVVSKAEGAVVDLATVEPRPEAVAFADRFQRDARQVEVVLREARRVVRMANGVLITETAHGFVCANGGIDASNVGPGTGQTVTLLPADPDASAATIRAAIRFRFGVGRRGRRLRLLRSTVALGDRRRCHRRQRAPSARGPARQPDADGRTMRVTVRAVADEMASAAELVLGKTAGRPVALVRGAHPPRGEGSIRDVVMAREFDLFP